MADDRFLEYWEKDAQYARAFPNAPLEPITPSVAAILTPSVAAILASGASLSAIAGEVFRILTIHLTIRASTDLG